MTTPTPLERPIIRLRCLDQNYDPFEILINTTKPASEGLRDTLMGRINDGTRALHENVLRLGKLLCEMTDSSLVSLELLGTTTTEMEH